MPRIGLGTWPLDGDELVAVADVAFQAGYRLLDTAENYRNEGGAGRAIRAATVPRDELFLTTKFNREWHGEDLVERALDGSLSRLGLDYVDLLLIHWPNPQHGRYIDAWRGMTRLLEDGRLRAIGTSNFTVEQLKRIIDATGVIPDVNQIQLSPQVSQPAIREFAAAHGIVVQSWSPLGSRRAASLFDKPVLRELATSHGKTPAQIVLRWHLQLGLAAVPKSANKERIRANIDVFDFELTPAEISSITALDGEVAPVDPETFGH